MAKIEAIPAFSDNYIWLLQNAGECWVIDPGDSQVVITALQGLNRPLTGILLTHHHFDHVGGVEDLVHLYKPLVVGPVNPVITHVDRRVGEGDTVIAAGLEWEVVEVPGHTLDHIAYFARNHSPPLLFCGDTLFAGGCGRVFEGTPEMMHASLQRLVTLPPDTEVYCAHEYTLANLAFAAAVEPANEALERRIGHEQAQRDRNIPTVPSRLDDELATNPFLRCDVPAINAAAARHSGNQPRDAVETFAAIREWKNNF